MKCYCLEEILPFGKYRGLPIREVIDLDFDYITWCLDNIPTFKLSKDAERAYDRFLPWIIVSSSDYVMPEDGVYLIACRGDNHIDYAIHEYHRGQRLWEFFEGENTISFGWGFYEPMGCYRLPPIEKWKVDKNPQRPDFYVVAILDNKDVVVEYSWAFDWNESDIEEVLSKGMKCKLLPHEAFGEWRHYEWLHVFKNL